MPESINLSQSTQPNYEQLTRFLIEPLLESKESLSVDCEIARAKEKVLIRVAIEEDEQGRVFGRGGRNIEAIRTTLEAAALASGQSARLEIYGVRDPIREFGGSSYDRESNGSRLNYGDGERRRVKKPYIARPASPSSPSRRPSLRRRRSSSENRGSSGNWRSSGTGDW